MAGKERARGAIDELPSGMYRVRVYAGVDPLTGKRHDLIELARTKREAERLRTKLLSQVDEQRNPRTRATVNQLLDRYLEVLDVEGTTRRTYEIYIARHIRPALGPLQVGRLNSDVVESFYAQLRRCRERCGGKAKHVKHRTQRKHECDDGCRVLPCQPLSASTVRQMHWILSGALARAVRWRWVAVNALDGAEPPAPPQPNASPPTPTDAGRLLAEAWKDPDWGAFIWTAMMTGARRSELCALLREDLDLEAAVLRIRAGLKLVRGQLTRAGTKNHQQRRIALDPETVAVLREYIERVDDRAAKIGATVDADAYLFTAAPDGETPLLPESVSQRYQRMAARLGISTTLHKLRHYSATELISAGVDVRTIAGRLGHGGGGTTTLKVYAAWVSEADQRAAAALGARLTRPGPDLPTDPADSRGNGEKKSRPVALLND